MADPHVLVVTSQGAAAASVVPVLAAIEAAGMRVRAIDVGQAGGGGGGVTDRVRRALLGEGAERKLKKELELNPPDAAVVFDPHAALALTVARDQVQNPAPVIAVVGDLDPAAAWANTDADRFVAVDDLAAVALADAGVEGERILVVGAIGERAFAEAGAQDRAGLRSRFKLGGKVALVEVAGLGAEHTGQLVLQLSLLDGGDQIQFLFDAANDADAAAVLRRQVPSLGLRGKLFGQTSDAPLLWRAADVIVARSKPETIARTLLVGGKLVALVDDTIPVGAKLAAALEARKRGVAVKGLLMLASALEGAFGGAHHPASEDGADHVADVVAAVASEKRAVIDERRLAAQAATRDRVRAASAAATAAVAQTAAAGDLEDLGGGSASSGPDLSDLPDKAELERLRGEVARRVSDMSKSMVAAREAAADLADKAKGAAARGAADEAAQLERRADAERARMHSMLAELAQLESELKELERSIAALGDRPPAADIPKAPPKATIDDELEKLKRGTPPRPAGSTPKSGPTKAKPPSNVDDELAALKKKMQQGGAPKKK